MMDHCPVLLKMRLSQIADFRLAFEDRVIAAPILVGKAADESTRLYFTEI